MPRPIAASSTKPGVAHDELGQHSGKWDYLSADGELLACIYRYDTPNGKQYRPWDVTTRSMRMPEPRPLYNLPTVSAVDAVIVFTLLSRFPVGAL